MSQIGDPATLLLDSIKQDISAVFPDEIHTVHFEDPSLVQDDPGYFVVDLVEIDENLEEGGGDQVMITFETELTGVFPRPKEGDPTQNVILFKILCMDRLAKRLMPSSRYAGIFILPTIRNRRLRELDNKQNDRVQFVMSFMCKCTIDHH